MKINCVDDSLANKHCYTCFETIKEKLSSVVLYSIKAFWLAENEILLLLCCDYLKL